MVFIDYMSPATLYNALHLTQLCHVQHIETEHRNYTGLLLHTISENWYKSIDTSTHSNHTIQQIYKSQFIMPRVTGDSANHVEMVSMMVLIQLMEWTTL